MRLSEEEKKMLSGEKLALIWPEEDLLPLKRKSPTGKQKEKGNSRLRPPPDNLRPDLCSNRCVSVGFPNSTKFISKIYIGIIYHRGRPCVFRYLVEPIKGKKK